MEELKNITFKGYASLMSEFKARSKNDWRCDVAEAYCVGLIVFLGLKEDAQNQFVSAFRASATRQAHTGKSIREEFEEALGNVTRLRETGMAPRTLIDEVGSVIEAASRTSGHRRPTSRKSPKPPPSDKDAA